MNTSETNRDIEQPLTPSLGATEEPVPGSSFKRTPLQQLRPWDHLNMPDQGEMGGNRGSTRRLMSQSNSVEVATGSSVGLLIASALVATVAFSLLRRR